MRAQPTSATRTPQALTTVSHAAEEQPGRLLISCDTCVARNTSACNDCIVPMLCGEPQTDAVIFDYEELRTLAVLAKSGLVPRLRHQRSA
jgi:hypothetical protein